MIDINKKFISSVVCIIKYCCQILNDKLNLNKGMLFENAIVTMLTANGHELYCTLTLW